MTSHIHARFGIPEEFDLHGTNYRIIFGGQPDAPRIVVLNEYRYAGEMHLHVCEKDTCPAACRREFPFQPTIGQVCLKVIDMGGRPAGPCVPVSEFGVAIHNLAHFNHGRWGNAPSTGKESR